MRLTGFIREHDNLTIANAINIMFNNDGFFGLVGLEEQIVLRVIDYLDKGAFLFGWMHYDIDMLTKEPLGPNAYYTDGIWIWPGYYTAYLKKYPDMMIEKEFLDYIINKQFINEAQTDTSINVDEVANILITKIEELYFR